MNTERFTSRSRAALAALALACVTAITGSAEAKDSPAAKISKILIDHQNFMALRIRLQGVSSFCDGGAQDPHVAYMAQNHALYDTILKTATAAYLAGEPVVVRAVKDGAFCRITGLILER